MLRSLYLTLQFLILFTSIEAQESIKLWDNKDALTCASSIMDALYKCEIETADSLLLQYHGIMGNHSSFSLLKAMNTYWSKSPFDYENDEDLDLLFEDLDQCISVATLSYESNENNYESVLFLLLARSVKARAYNAQGSTWKAVSEAKQVYTLTRVGMKNVNNFSEFKFSTGIYNYFREFFPEARPIYRPFLSFFPSGDIELGITQLEEAKNNSIFTSAEAQRYLMWIYTRKKNLEAKEIAYDFLENYADNGLFTFESLLTLNFFGELNGEEVLPYIHSLEDSDREIFKVGGKMMYGIYYFNKGDYSQSKKYLVDAEVGLNNMKNRQKYIDSPLYAYLYALNVLEGNESQSRYYEKKAEDTAYGNKIIDHINNKLLSRL